MSGFPRAPYAFTWPTFPTSHLSVWLSSSSLLSSFPFSLPLPIYYFYFFFSLLFLFSFSPPASSQDLSAVVFATAVSSHLRLPTFLCTWSPLLPPPLLLLSSSLSLPLLPPLHSLYSFLPSPFSAVNFSSFPLLSSLSFSSSLFPPRHLSRSSCGRGSGSIMED